MRPERPDDDDDDALVEGYLSAVSGRAWGITVGLVCGLCLFVVTNVLVLKGGENMGAHLGLLINYFPFYGVSFVGSLIGFVYAFVIGYVVGRVGNFLYVLLTRR